MFHTNNLLVIIILGGIAGGLAKLLMPGRDPAARPPPLRRGVAGAVLGTWLGQVLHLYGPGEKAGFVGAVVGAFLILLVYRLVAGRRRI